MTIDTGKVTPQEVQGLSVEGGYRATATRDQIGDNEASSDSYNYIYVPAKHCMARRAGSKNVEDNSPYLGILTAHWNAVGRRMVPYTSMSSNPNNDVTVGVLMTKEVSSPSPITDDGLFGAFAFMDPGSGVFHELLSDILLGAVVYPTNAAGTPINYFCVPPIWYDSGAGGMTVGMSTFSNVTRRFFFAGSRDAISIGGWTYFPNYSSTPFRVNRRWSAAGNYDHVRVALTGPMPPCVEPTIAPGPDFANLTGSWQHDNSCFFVSYAYRFEDDSVWMPMVPRPVDGTAYAGTDSNIPGGTVLPNGFGLVNLQGSIIAGHSSQYIVWTLPAPPVGVKSVILLRTTATNGAATPLIVPPLYENGFPNLRVVAEIPANQTTYNDFLGPGPQGSGFPGDLALFQDVDQLFIHFAHQMQPPSRYMFAGDLRCTSTYGRQNPALIFITPKNGSPDSALMQSGASGIAPSFYRVAWYATGGGGGWAQLELFHSDGTPYFINLRTVGTIQRVVDLINTSTKWRAALAPGASPATPSHQLLPMMLFDASATPQPHFTNGNPDVQVAHDLYNMIAIGTRILGTGENISTYINGAASLIAGLVEVPAGAWVKSKKIVAGNYYLTMSAPATGTFSDFATFFFDFGTDGFAGLGGGHIYGFAKTFCNAFPAPIYFRKPILSTGTNYFTETIGDDFARYQQYLLDLERGKRSIWTTQGGPGRPKTAPNSWTTLETSRHMPPGDSGYSLGGGAVLDGFVYVFSRAIYKYMNTTQTNSGKDEDYRLVPIDLTGGCVSWRAVARGNGFVAYVKRDGIFAANLGYGATSNVLATFYQQGSGVVLVSDAVIAPGLGPSALFDELQISAASVERDDDSQWLGLSIARNALELTYRSSAAQTRPDRRLRYDFSKSPSAEGIAQLQQQGTGAPWPWSTPLVQAYSMIFSVRRYDGEHLYGFSEENLGVTGDGRMDEIDTGRLDGIALVGARLYLKTMKTARLNWRMRYDQIAARVFNGGGLLLTFSRDAGRAQELAHAMAATVSGIPEDRRVPLLLPLRSPTTIGEIGFTDDGTGIPSEVYEVEVRGKLLPTL